MNLESYTFQKARSGKKPAVTSSPFAIMWMFASIVLCMLVLANFSVGLLSAVRAYVVAESVWAAGQKDAVFHLDKYATSRAPEQLQAFCVEIEVPLGDREARLEMDFDRLREAIDNLDFQVGAELLRESRSMGEAA